MLKKLVSLFLFLSLLLPTASAANRHAAAAADNIRGVWVSSVFNIDYPSDTGLSKEALQTEADKILDNVVKMGLNTVFLQVRPSADALYQSTLFPWSRFVSGTIGQAPDGNFDVLSYWITAAHDRGLQLHAWLNPYRVTTGEDLDSLPENSPARLHPEWLVEYNERYYFDPGLPAVQELVLSGAEEIVRNYDVDGIHLDDYFYPDPDFNDAATFARYGKDFDNIDDWRRDNVNTLIASMDKSLHKIKPELLFGVSPAGIWDNKRDNPKGSDTRGRSSYREIYCDSLEWIDKGTVDYICPQLYWNIGYEIADFSILTEWWQDAVAASDVALYIGVGAYRSAEAKPGDVWYGTDELKRQLEMIDDAIDIQGEVFFSYSSLLDVDGCADMLTEHYQKNTTKPDDTDAKPERPIDEQSGLLEILSRFLTGLFY